jgi:hypothetical protein
LRTGGNLAVPGRDGLKQTQAGRRCGPDWKEFTFSTPLASTARRSRGSSAPINIMKNKEKPLPGVDVLNTGYGDLEIHFDPDKPDEVQKAKETITDMLKRGYAIFVRQGKQTFRVRKFDVDKNVYIIGSTPSEEVPIAETRATAVGRSAGG